MIGVAHRGCACRWRDSILRHLLNACYARPPTADRRQRESSVLTHAPWRVGARYGRDPSGGCAGARGGDKPRLSSSGKRQQYGRLSPSRVSRSFPFLVASHRCVGPLPSTVRMIRSDCCAPLQIPRRRHVLRPPATHKPRRDLYCPVHQLRSNAPLLVHRCIRSLATGSNSN
jgi:hypothetical protein